MGEFIAQQLYPDIKREDLSEEQRQTISALTKAIKRSHIGPSVGDEYKIHGSAKLVISAGYGGGGYLESVLTEDKLSINAGVTKVLGWWAEASIGLDFGPYPIDILKPQYDYAANFSLGIIPIDGLLVKRGLCRI